MCLTSYAILRPAMDCSRDCKTEVKVKSNVKSQMSKTQILPKLCSVNLVHIEIMVFQFYTKAQRHHENQSNFSWAHVIWVRKLKTIHPNLNCSLCL